MSLSASAIAAALPAAHIALQGAKGLSSAIFSLAESRHQPTAVEPTEGEQVASNSEEKPTAAKRLENLLHTIRLEWRKVGIDSKTNFEIQADGERTPRVFSEDLEATQHLEEWFASHPEQLHELQSIVRDLRSAGILPESIGHNVQDPRKQTLTIESSSKGTNWTWSRDVLTENF